MSIKDCFKQKTTKNSSTKNAAFYNAEKTKCIVDMSIHSSPAVREAIASNEHTPTKVLTSMLMVEQEKSVLRAVLLNVRLPRKAAASFVSDSNDVRVDFFEDDEDIIAHFDRS